MIFYINGLPLVVFEFKTAIKEDVTIHNAFRQLTVTYRRNIPELFKYNAFCVISDGVNSKAGSFFAKEAFFYAWRKITGDEKQEKSGIDSMYTLIQGMFDRTRLRDIIRNFIYIPDNSHKEEKILCRYPQYYAANKLFDHIKAHKKPEGDGKGGTYFGATGCGKSFIMLFLTRLLMRSRELASPTIVVITDRTDLDEQLSKQFTNAKNYVGDDSIQSVTSREHLRELLQGRNSGGVFLTTIHKFTEDTQLLSERSNVICISDEAHRSQVNLDQKIKLTDEGAKKTFGFAKYLHDSLPNASYVGFTGTPIDATIDVFGPVVDAYTMKESVTDEITVRIVYEGRAAKVLLDNEKLQDIEKYYDEAAEAGANEYQVEESKKASAKMTAIIGDPDRIKAVAEDFVKHYEKRVEEGSTVKGKAMFVCSSRKIAYAFYQEVVALRPEWAEVRTVAAGEELSDSEQKKIKPIEMINMVMTRNKEDDDDLYKSLGTKEYKSELDRQFKEEKSNFKIAIVVDMWLTGFDVPFLDTIYIDKPLQKHTLIQTISRVNRNYTNKNKGLVVDYIGIKSRMNQALAMYSKQDESNFEDIAQSIIVVKDHLHILSQLFHTFDESLYFSGNPSERLECLNKASEFVMLTQKQEKRYMALVKRLKAAYDVCCGSEELTEEERDYIHFYLAVRSIIHKLTKGEAPDTAQMNEKVRDMIREAIKSDGVQEIYQLGDKESHEIDLFDEDYLDKINGVKLPNTKIKLLQQLLQKAIEEFKKTNRAKGIDFSKKFQSLVEQYNERKEKDTFEGKVYDDIAEQFTNMIMDMKAAFASGDEMGISFEAKAFYDILQHLAHKYDFEYPDEKLIPLSEKVKGLVDDKAKYTDWNKRDDIKAELKAHLVVLLGENDYPPVDRDEVYKEIFEQAENFKKYN
jgi:type I restriction enzyme R subunit